MPPVPLSGLAAIGAFIPFGCKMDCMLVEEGLVGWPDDVPACFVLGRFSSVGGQPGGEKRPGPGRGCPPPGTVPGSCQCRVLEMPPCFFHTTTNWSYCFYSRKNIHEVFAKIDFDDDPNPACVITGGIRYWFPKGLALWACGFKTDYFCKSRMFFENATLARGREFLLGDHGVEGRQIGQDLGRQLALASHGQGLRLDVGVLA